MVDQPRRQRLLAGERALVDQPAHLGRARACGPARCRPTSWPLSVSSSASAARGWAPESWLSVRLSRAVLYSARRRPRSSMPGSPGGRAPAAPAPRARSARPGPPAAARSRRRRWRDSSPRCRSSARRSCRHRRSRTCRRPGSARTASRSSWVTARPCAVSASRTSRPATRGSAAAASERQHDVADGGRRRQLEVEQVGRPGGLAERRAPVGGEHDPLGQGSRRAAGTARQRRPPARIASRSEAADGGEQADQEAAHRRPGLRPRSAGGSRRRWLSVLSWPQAARMSRPRGVRTGEAWPPPRRSRRRRGCGCSTSRRRARRARG